MSQVPAHRLHSTSQFVSTSACQPSSPSGCRAVPTYHMPPAPSLAQHLTNSGVPLVITPSLNNMSISQL